VGDASGNTANPAVVGTPNADAANRCYEIVECGAPTTG
jgi:hypothetical protein